MPDSPRPLPPLPSAGGSYELDPDAWAWVKRDESDPPEPQPISTTED